MLVSHSPADLEDIYQGAWLSVVRTKAAVRNLEHYLYEAVHSQGLMDAPATTTSTTPLSDLAESGVRADDAEKNGVATDDLPDPNSLSPEEHAERRLMGAWAQDLLRELSQRQASVVKLRWGWGLSRREIAGVLGVSEKVVKRDLELGGARLSEVVEELRSGRWCERRRSLVTAYALELLSPSRAARAEAHLRACSGCRGLVRELRRRAEGVAAGAPAPLLADPSAHGPLASIGAVLDSARSQLSDLVSSAKQQAFRCRWERPTRRRWRARGRARWRWQ